MTNNFPNSKYLLVSLFFLNTTDNNDNTPRLTKLELQAEERKSFTNDLSNAVRHRMERTDAELDQVNTQLEGIKSSIMNLGQQYVDIKTTLREIPTQG